MALNKMWTVYANKTAAGSRSSNKPPTFVVTTSSHDHCVKLSSSWPGHTLLDYVGDDQQYTRRCSRGGAAVYHVLSHGARHPAITRLQQLASFVSLLLIPFSHSSPLSMNIIGQIAGIATGSARSPTPRSCWQETEEYSADEPRRYIYSTSRANFLAPRRGGPRENNGKKRKEEKNMDEPACYSHQQQEPCARRWEVVACLPCRKIEAKALLAASATSGYSDRWCVCVYTVYVRALRVWFE
jgi:hypothetical protein